MVTSQKLLNFQIKQLFKKLTLSDVYYKTDRSCKKAHWDLEDPIAFRNSHQMMKNLPTVPGYSIK